MTTPAPRAPTRDPGLRALVLDLGEVLVHPQRPEAVAELAALAGAPQEPFARAYWTHRDLYDQRGDAQAYWRAVLAELRAEITAARVAALVEADARSWSVRRPEVWRAAAEARAAGLRTAVLSNCGPEIIARVDADGALRGGFDAVVVSWEERVLKPDPEIYRRCLARLGVPAPAALFVDDRAVNVAAAAALGLRTLHYTGEASTAALRARLGLEPA